ESARVGTDAAFDFGTARREHERRWPPALQDAFIALLMSLPAPYRAYVRRTLYGRVEAIAAERPVTPSDLDRLLNELRAATALKGPCSKSGERHEHRRLELSPPGLNDLRQNARVPCEAQGRYRLTDRCKKGHHQGGRRAGRPEGRGRAVRRQGQEDRARRPQAREAAARRAARPVARAHRQSARADAAQRPQADRRLRRAHL